MECTFNLIMDSESDAEEYISAANLSKDKRVIFLAMYLKNYPEFLDKSQKPEAKKKKEVATNLLVKAYQEHFRYPITAKQIMKMINNTKTRLKKKSALKRNGKKCLALNNWERVLYDLLIGDTKTPITETSGSEDMAYFKLEDESAQPSEGMNLLTSAEEYIDEFVTPTKQLKAEKYETEESRALTTEELQRVVLIEQLAAARAQKEYYTDMLIQKRNATTKL